MLHILSYSNLIRKYLIAQMTRIRICSTNWVKETFPVMQSFVTIFIINPSVEENTGASRSAKKVHVLFQRQRSKKMFGLIALMGQILSRDVCPTFSFKDPFFPKSEVFQPWNFRSFFFGKYINILSWPSTTICQHHLIICLKKWRRFKEKKQKNIFKTWKILSWGVLCRVNTLKK